jgi:phospholipase/carboxylesterase
MPAPTHAHKFVAGIDISRAPLVLLHGSDGHETDLLPLAGELAPGAAKLGVRGTVATDLGYAFFRRFPNRRVDEADIAARVPVLAEFIETSCAGFNLTRRPVIVGFSSGAIMAAALLMARPGLMAGAVLFRPLSPFTDHVPNHFDNHLDSTPVLIIDGAQDSRRSPADGLRLAERLRRAGALVTQHLLPVGHALTAEDARIAGEWLRALKPR